VTTAVRSPETAAQTCARLRAATEEALRPLLPRDARVALVGTGLGNVGDCAIAVATRRWLSRALDRAWLELDRRTYDRDVAARFLGPDGIVLHAGGGTMGDVWASQESLRRRALDDFGHLRSVQLPQTVHFTSAEGAREARRFYRDRRDLTVLVRDEPSLRIARDEWGLDARLSPDMAFLLDLRPTTAPTRDVVWLLRADQESERATPERTLRPSPVAEALDWPPPGATLHRELRRLVARTLRSGADAARRRRFLASLDAAWAERRTQDGARLLSSGRVVATDRLHGLIFALLLGIPVHATGDRNGKVRAFHRAWLGDAGASRFHESVEDVRAAVEERAAA
jgi:pyruvyl transferase EpsO